MIMHWIRVKLYEFLAPLLLPVLDDCNKRNLQDYYKIQREEHQLNNVMRIETQDWLRSNKDCAQESKQQHQDLLDRWDKLISLLEKK